VTENDSIVAPPPVAEPQAAPALPIEQAPAAPAVPIEQAPAAPAVPIEQAPAAPAVPIEQAPAAPAVPIAIDDTQVISTVGAGPIIEDETPDAPRIAAPSTTIVLDSVTASGPGIGAAASTEPGAQELVTCPDCGTTAMITLNRREARDFCRNCDFPLFWTPSAIQREADGATAAETLRRLPGTGGRATVAAVPCPHCSEPNTVAAVVCARCGLPMVLPEPAPIPEPVAYAPPPAPVVLEEPAKGVPWWVWALIASGFVITVTLIILAVTGVFS
jgi:hypothetical protein